MKDDKLYLIHIRECIDRVESYVRAGGKTAFLASTLIQDAVLRNLQVMAESTQRLSDALKSAHPEIDWRQISGFRNVVVHSYLNVEPDRVWLVIEQDLPSLKRSAAVILKELEDE
ncbi:MAG: DUF86 domain-containing protein [Anaerolineae bacterium]|nr:DUF86 domain-containing protein [Anaerolineae bacterium]